MCWLLQSKAREKIAMRLEWQAEVSHSETAGPNDISVLRELECQHASGCVDGIWY